MKVEQIKELLDIQKEVNDFILDRAKWKPHGFDFKLALFVELFEFINTIPHWKWWKFSQEIDRENTLDELADIMAFYLSYVLVEIQKDQQVNHVKSAFNTAEENKNYEPNDTEYSIGRLFNSIEYDMDVIMGNAISVVQAALDASLDEIVDAYKKKSIENIERQKRNY